MMRGPGWGGPFRDFQGPYRQGPNNYKNWPYRVWIWGSAAGGRQRAGDFVNYFTNSDQVTNKVVPIRAKIDRVSAVYSSIIKVAFKIFIFLPFYHAVISKYSSNSSVKISLFASMVSPFPHSSLTSALSSIKIWYPPKCAVTLVFDTPQGTT